MARFTQLVFREGNVAQAVRASISIPGVFQPFRYQGRLLVDGAVKNRLPIHIAKKMGADKILAVDVKKALSSKVNTAMNVLFQYMEILEEEVFRAVCKGADLLIQPEDGHISSLQFDAAAEAIAWVGRPLPQRQPKFDDFLRKDLKIERIMIH